MPLGHEISLRGESFDFYLFDPNASSDEDLKLPSLDSIFHIRSRISGQFLPFIGLSRLKGDPGYQEHVQKTLARVIQSNGQDRDITALMPNVEIVKGASGYDGLSFEHLVDDRWSTNRRRLEPSTYREQSITDFLSREAYSRALFTPISRLHWTEENVLKSESYHSLMSLMAEIALKGRRDIKQAISVLSKFKNRAFEQDGKIEFNPSEDGQYIPSKSRSMKQRFFKEAHKIFEYLIDEYPDDKDILALGSQLNKICHLSEASAALDRIARQMSVDVSELESEGGLHPAIIAAAHMMTDSNPFLSVSDLTESGLFHPSNQATRVRGNNWGSRFTPCIEAMRFMCQEKTPEAMRNIFFLADRMQWSPRLFENFASDSSALFPPGSSAILFWKDIEKGISLREAIRKAVVRHSEGLSNESSVRPLSKRAVNLYLQNAIAIDSLNDALELGQDSGLQTLYTDSGERFVIRAHSREGSLGVNSNKAKQSAEITYFDRDDNIVFHHDDIVDRGNSPSIYKELNFKSIFRDPLHFLQLPPGKIRGYWELNAVVGSQARNKTLSDAMARGYLQNLDQVRDEQGRKVERKQYQSWMDVVIKHAHDQDAFEKYHDTQYLSDSNHIGQDIEIALFLHLAKQSGIEVGTLYSVDEFNDDDNAINKASAFTLDGCSIEMDSGELDITKSHGNKINYKKDMVEVAERLHNVGASLVKDHIPRVNLEWEPATEIIGLGALEDGTQVYAKPLSSYGEIQRHGDSMGHCAGTYAGQCMSGKYYLWAIMGISSNGEHYELSTLGMVHDGSELEFDQHYAHYNASVKGQLSDFVEGFSESLIHSSRDEYYSEGYEEDHDEFYFINSDKEVPVYHVSFFPTAYERGRDLTQEEVAEVIANYHWQGDDFGKDAMRLLARVYGEHQVKESLIDVIETNLEENEGYYPDELKVRLNDMKNLVLNYANDTSLQMEV